MRHYLSLITVAVLHVSAKWRTAHHLTKGKSRMFELIHWSSSVLDMLNSLEFFCLGHAEFIGVLLSWTC